MLAAIHFDNETSLERHEIYDVSSDHRLSLELHALETMSTKEIPQASLGLCHIGTKSFGVTKCHTPLPTRRFAARHPLPQGDGDCPRTLGLNRALERYNHSAA